MMRKRRRMKISKRMMMIFLPSLLPVQEGKQILMMILVVSKSKLSTMKETSSRVRHLIITDTNQRE